MIFMTAILMNLDIFTPGEFASEYSGGIGRRGSVVMTDKDPSSSLSSLCSLIGLLPGEDGQAQ